LRTVCATREEAQRTFLVFTFTYGLGAARPLRVGEAPGGTVWEAPVTAVGRDARVCMSCDRYVPIFDCSVDANLICMSCMLAGRGPQSMPVLYATPRPPVALLAPAHPLTAVVAVAPADAPLSLIVEAEGVAVLPAVGRAVSTDTETGAEIVSTQARRRRGGRRHSRGRSSGSDTGSSG